MPSGHVHAPQPMASNVITSYQPHQHQPLLQQQYGPPSSSYNHFNGYSNGLPSSQNTSHVVSGQMCHQPSVLPLPQPVPMAHTNLPGPNYGAPPGFDVTGQIAPPGMKPRVTATLWEDEGSLCFQVEAKGVCVARREDNQMINGTKLLNVAGMTRGRRDGILKSEKLRHVVKIGPMHLKGVWIPFERALDFANKEKITELLYPLFVYNIGALLYHPTNQTRTNAVMQAAERQKLEQSTIRNSQALSLPSLNQHHHSVGPSAPSQSSGQSHAITSHSTTSRSNLERTPNFPTPPTSASSVVGASGNAEGNFQWGAQTSIVNAPNSSSLSIDTVLSNGRTLPNTPATTPPGSSAQGIHYSQSSSPYDVPRQAYQTQPQQNSYPQTVSEHQSLAQYSKANQYLKNNMGPPKPRPHVAEVESLDKKITEVSTNNAQSQPSQIVSEDDRENEHEAEYTHGASSNFDPNRAPFRYTSVPAVGPLSNENPHPPNDLPGPSAHQSPGRATPRTASQQPYYPQTSGYTTSPRVQNQSNNTMTVKNAERSTLNSDSSNDLYNPQSENTLIVKGYSNKQPLPRSSGSSFKRCRDDDDELKTIVRENYSDNDGPKRRKMATVQIASYESQNLNLGRAQTTQRRR
ncbi:Cell pattern formation-associated protein [Podosphaera aphanis]|nr:Cell pattern formation-associated protein [Podosphaera aphanis]